MAKVTKINTCDNTLIEVKNFHAAYGMVPAAKQLELRNNLMEICGWKAFKTFHAKRQGLVKITILEIPAIEVAFEQYNIDAWTGEYIKPLAEV